MELAISARRSTKRMVRFARSSRTSPGFATYCRSLHEFPSQFWTPFVFPFTFLLVPCLKRLYCSTKIYPVSSHPPCARARNNSILAFAFPLHFFPLRSCVPLSTSCPQRHTFERALVAFSQSQRLRWSTERLIKASLAWKVQTISKSDRSTVYIGCGRSVGYMQPRV
jgi:hypothetical protein